MQQMELDYHTPKEYTSMKLEDSLRAKEIIDAYLEGETILLRYKGISSKWFDLETTAHNNWNFNKYEYKVEPSVQT